MFLSIWSFIIPFWSMQYWALQKHFNSYWRPYYEYHYNLNDYQKCWLRQLLVHPLCFDFTWDWHIKLNLLKSIGNYIVNIPTVRTYNFEHGNANILFAFLQNPTITPSQPRLAPRSRLTSLPTFEVRPELPRRRLRVPAASLRRTSLIRGETKLLRTSATSSTFRHCPPPFRTGLPSREPNGEISFLFISRLTPSLNCKLFNWKKTFINLVKKTGFYWKIHSIFTR